MKRIFVHPQVGGVGAGQQTHSTTSTQTRRTSGQSSGSSSFNGAAIGNLLNGSAQNMAGSALNGVADSVGNAIGGEGGQIASTLLKEAMNILKTFFSYNIGDGAKESAEELNNVQKEVSEMKSDSEQTLAKVKDVSTQAESAVQETQTNMETASAEIQEQTDNLNAEVEQATIENEEMQTCINDLQAQIEQLDAEKCALEDEFLELSPEDQEGEKGQALREQIMAKGESMGTLMEAQQTYTDGIMANTEKISANAEGVFEITQELSDSIDCYAKDITSVLGNSEAAIGQMTNMLSSKFSGMDANMLIKLATEVTKAAVEGVESGILISAGTALEGAAVVTMGATAEQGAEMIAKGGGKSADAIARGVTKMMGSLAEQMAKQAVSMTLNNIASAIAPNNAELRNMITSVGDMAISGATTAIESSQANVNTFLSAEVNPTVAAKEE